MKSPIDSHTHLTNTMSFYVTQKPDKKYYIDYPGNCQGFSQKSFSGKYKCLSSVDEKTYSSLVCSFSHSASSGSKYGEIFS